MQAFITPPSTHLCTHFHSSRWPQFGQIEIYSGMGTICCYCKYLHAGTSRMLPRVLASVGQNQSQNHWAHSICRYEAAIISSQVRIYVAITQCLISTPQMDYFNH